MSLEVKMTKVEKLTKKGNEKSVLTISGKSSKDLARKIVPTGMKTKRKVFVFTGVLVLVLPEARGLLWLAG